MPSASAAALTSRAISMSSRDGLDRPTDGCAPTPTPRALVRMMRSPGNQPSRSQQAAGHSSAPPTRSSPASSKWRRAPSTTGSRAFPSSPPPGSRAGRWPTPARPEASTSARSAVTARLSAPCCGAAGRGCSPRPCIIRPTSAPASSGCATAGVRTGATARSRRPTIRPMARAGGSHATRPRKRPYRTSLATRKRLTVTWRDATSQPARSVLTASSRRNR